MLSLFLIGVIIKHMKYKKTLLFIGSVLICEAAGIIGSIFTMPAISGWYAFLNKPKLAPPNWIFGPVWTSLFFLMGISLYLVLTSNAAQKRKAAGVFFLQLVLNIWWSVLFFGMQSPFLALIEIVVLWVSILYSIIYFLKISKWAGILLLPYMAWVSFAALLNFLLWRLNL